MRMVVAKAAMHDPTAPLQEAMQLIEQTQESVRRQA